MALLVSYVSHPPVDDFGLLFATLKYSAALVASVDTSLTIPGDARTYKAVIKVSAEVWIALNAVATIPAGASFAVTNSEAVGQYYHLCREVKAGDVFHFLSPVGADVSVVLYALNPPN